MELFLDCGSQRVFFSNSSFWPLGPWSPLTLMISKTTPLNIFKIASNQSISHSWAKFKIVLVRKPEGKLYSFHAKICQNTIFGSSRISFRSFNSIFQGRGFSFQFLISKNQGSGFSFQFLIAKFQGHGFSFQFLKNYHNLTISRVILTFSQEFYYLKNKVGVVDFTKACRLVKFQSPRALQAHGHLQNLLLLLYFWGNVSLQLKCSMNF